MACQIIVYYSLWQFHVFPYYGVQNNNYNFIIVLIQGYLIIHIIFGVFDVIAKLRQHWCILRSNYVRRKNTWVVLIYGCLDKF